MSHIFYDFSAKDLGGREIAMSDFKNKIVLVVNTASECGLTPQFEGLEALYKKYKDKDFVILGFPCNQFGGQEPGDEATIATGCVLNYGVTFPMFSKVDVNGENAHPIFKFLKSNLKGFLTEGIKWNFTKFLIDKNGNPIKRYSPMDKPDKIEKDLAKILA